MTKKEPKLVQMEFMDTLSKTSVSDPSSCKQSSPKSNERKTLPRNQQVGFREDYNKAMITLYVIGSLFNTQESREDMPEEIRNELDKAKKTQARYEKYNPRAKQNIIHYGRDVADAYMSSDPTYLSVLEYQAERSKYPDKRHMCHLTKKIVDKMVDIIRLQNEII